MLKRSLKAFKGRGLVVGCSHSFACGTHLHDHSKDFYTLDLSASIGPDCVFDLTNRDLPAELAGRFDVVMTEHLTWSAYNAWEEGFIPGCENRNKDGYQGFLNLWRMTQSDGFILIYGSMRSKDYRKSFYVPHKLKHLELTAEGDVVLIPKNQSLTIEAVRERVRTDPFLFDLIKKVTGDLTAWSFCALSYENLPTLRGSLLNSESTEHGLNTVKIAIQVHASCLQSEIEVLEEKLQSSCFRCFIQYEINTKKQKKGAIEPLLRYNNMSELLVAAQNILDNKTSAIVHRRFYNSATKHFGKSRTVNLLNGILTRYSVSRPLRNYSRDK